MVPGLFPEVYDRHDGAGNPVLIVGPTGARITAVYNGLGMRTSMTDPDRGSWAFQYYADGDLLVQSDGRGWALHWARDRLGRVVGEYEDKVAQVWIPLNHWQYDVERLGLLHATWRAGAEGLYRRDIRYDALSRPNLEKVQIREKRHPALAYHAVNNPYVLDRSWRRELAYDRHHGWLKQEFRGPDDLGTFAGNRYHTGGYGLYQSHDRYGYRVEEGGVPDWNPDPDLRMYGRRIVGMDAWGNATVQQLGNRPTAATPPMVQADNYHPQTGQLFRRCVGPSAVHCTILSYSYTYDGWGNVKTQEETVAAPGRRETFV